MLLKLFIDWNLLWSRWKILSSAFLLAILQNIIEVICLIRGRRYEAIILTGLEKRKTKFHFLTIWVDRTSQYSLSWCPHFLKHPAKVCWSISNSWILWIRFSKSIRMHCPWWYTSCHYWSIWDASIMPVLIFLEDFNLLWKFIKFRSKNLLLCDGGL